jgi:hypothetical protein
LCGRRVRLAPLGGRTFHNRGWMRKTSLPARLAGRVRDSEQITPTLKGFRTNSRSRTLAVPSLGRVLLREAGMCYPVCMTNPASLIEHEEDTAEAQALAAAIAESDVDPRTAPREEVLTWLPHIANGEFDARPPEPR